MTMVKTGDAAAKCGVSRETIRKWVDRGNLPNSRTIQNPKTGKKQFLIDSRDIEEICEPDKARAESRVIAASVKMEERAKKLEKSQRSFENSINQFKQEFYNSQRNKQDLTPVLQKMHVIEERFLKIEQDISHFAQLSYSVKRILDIVSQTAVPKDEDTPVQKQPVRKPVRNDYNKFGGR